MNGYQIILKWATPTVDNFEYTHDVSISFIEIDAHIHRLSKIEAVDPDSTCNIFTISEIMELLSNDYAVLVDSYRKSLLILLNHMGREVDHTLDVIYSCSSRVATTCGIVYGFICEWVTDVNVDVMSMDGVEDALNNINKQILRIKSNIHISTEFNNTLYDSIQRAIGGDSEDNEDNEEGMK